MELQDGGLRAELERLGRQYKMLPLVVDWREGVDVPESLEPLAVSILNEALRNAEKHANPAEVRVTIDERDGAFALEVRNDGLPPRRRGEYARRLADGPAARLLRGAAARRNARVRPGGGPMASAPGAAEQLNGAEKLRVLVVDDHAVVQWGFRLLLGRQPWVGDCVVASTPEEAVELAGSGRPDVALVDLFLGERSGAELCEALREASPKTRVLLISGAGWISPEAAKAAGAAGFISKDWSADEVANAVRMVGRGMTVYARQADGPGDPALAPRARGPGADRRGSHQPRDRRAPLPLAPHDQGPHHGALPQAGSAKPGRGDAKGRAAGLDAQRSARLGSAPRVEWTVGKDARDGSREGD